MNPENYEYSVDDIPDNYYVFSQDPDCSFEQSFPYDCLDEFSDNNPFSQKAYDELHVKSMVFALRMIKLHQYISKSKKEYFLSKKAMESATEIGAILLNIPNAFSDEMIYNIISEALDETERTSYYLQLLYKSNYLDEKEFRSIYGTCMELKNAIRNFR